jgi:hypothetical protein
VLIVGGALFPRTALALLDLLPAAAITVIDCNADHIRLAIPFVGGRIRFIHGFYPGNDAGNPDLVVIPLSFIGDRKAIAAMPRTTRERQDSPAPTLLVHDWLWRRSGQSVIVSVALLKRINLIKP